MSKQPNQKQEHRVRKAFCKVLSRDGRVDWKSLLIEMGALQPKDVQQWYQGKVPFLEAVIRVNLTALARYHTAVRRLAKEMNLKRSLTGPKKGRRYSKSGLPVVEEEYHAVYFPRDPEDPDRCWVPK